MNLLLIAYTTLPFGIIFLQKHITDEPQIPSYSEEENREIQIPFSIYSYWLR